MIAYKVVDVKKNKRRISATAFDKLNCESTEYVKGKITRPKKGCGPLCAFRFVENAINFGYGKEVWAAKVKESKASRIYNKTGSLVHRFLLPPETILCDEVTILYKVHTKKSRKRSKE